MQSVEKEQKGKGGNDSSSPSRHIKGMICGCQFDYDSNSLELLTSYSVC